VVLKKLVFQTKLQDRNLEIQAQMTEVEKKIEREKREIINNWLGCNHYDWIIYFSQRLNFSFWIFASTWVIAAAFRKAIFND